MPSTDKTPDATVKLSMRIDSTLWAAWSKLAARAGYDPIDYLKLKLAAEVADADPAVLEPNERDRFRRRNRLIQKVMELAVSMEFSTDITLRVFQKAMKDDGFRADYTTQIGGADPYAHGNPLKEVNRELGRHIKNAVGAEVVRDENGEPDEHRNIKGEVIQSYTRLRRPNSATA